MYKGRLPEERVQAWFDEPLIIINRHWPVSGGKHCRGGVAVDATPTGRGCHLMATSTFHAVAAW